MERGRGGRERETETETEREREEKKMMMLNKKIDECDITERLKDRHFELIPTGLKNYRFFILISQTAILDFTRRPEGQNY